MGEKEQEEGQAQEPEQDNPEKTRVEQERKLGDQEESTGAEPASEDEDDKD